MRTDGCSCEKCVDCCKHLPGIPMPDEVPRIAEHLKISVTELLQKYFVAGWRSGMFSDDDEIRFVYPAKTWAAGHTEDWGYPLSRGDCIFLKDNKCSIHEVAPHECRKVFACDKSPDKIIGQHRNDALREWQKSWEENTLHSEIIAFIDTAPRMDSWHIEKKYLEELMMKNVYEILEKIEVAQGTNKKLDILAELVRIPEGEKLLRLVFNSDVLGVSDRSLEKACDYSAESDGVYMDPGLLVFGKAKGKKSLSMSEVENFVQKLKESAGNASVEHLKTLLDLRPQEAKWITRLVLKDLRIGISDISVNKVLKNMGKAPIEKFEVQLCGLLDFSDRPEIVKKVTFPCGVGIKYDGERAVLEKTAGRVTLTSRQGKNIDYVPEIIAAAEKELPDGIILDGEILCKTFNALQQRLGRKLENIEPIEGLHFRVFDILRLGGQDIHSHPQSNRWEWANLVPISDNFKIEEKKIANNLDDVEAFFKMACKRGEEGIIVKLLDKPYAYGSRKHWFKIKPVFENTFVITGSKMGTGKYAGMISTIFVEDKNQRVKSGVGSGLTENDILAFMNLDRQGKLIGTCVDIAYNEITQTDDGMSLRFPRLLKIRYDKIQPDAIVVQEKKVSNKPGYF